MAFFLIPFSYFYGNASNERFNENQQYLNVVSSTQDRVIKSVKKTVRVNLLT